MKMMHSLPRQVPQILLLKHMGVYRSITLQSSGYS